jgi:hypothetical protein
LFARIEQIIYGKNQVTTHKGISIFVTCSFTAISVLFVSITGLHYLLPVKIIAQIIRMGFFTIFKNINSAIIAVILALAEIAVPLLRF